MQKGNLSSTNKTNGQTKKIKVRTAFSGQTSRIVQNKTTLLFDDRSDGAIGRKCDDCSSVSVNNKIIPILFCQTIDGDIIIRYCVVPVFVVVVDVVDGSPLRCCLLLLFFFFFNFVVAVAVAKKLSENRFPPRSSGYGWENYHQQQRR
jgi:hypothetical protein